MDEDEVVQMLANVPPAADTVFVLWLEGQAVNYEWLGKTPAEIARVLRHTLAEIEAGHHEVVPANTKH